jgi:hypothetical protein
MATHDVRFHAYTSSMRPQVVAGNRLFGTQEKTVHRRCAVGGEMKTPRQVAQWREQKAEACRLDAAIDANFKDLGYGR